MAIKINEVLHPRPGLLVVRQTRVETTLKTSSGIAILCMLIYFEYKAGIISLNFLEGLNWVLIFIATFFS